MADVTPAMIANWQSSLESLFGPWPMLAELDVSEKAHCKEIHFRGYGFLTLMRSYQEFALLTIDEAKESQCTLDLWNVALNIVALRRFRSGWLAYLAGYYFDAGSTLRSVLEITCYLAVVARGHFGYDELARLDEDAQSLKDGKFKKALEAHHRKLNATVKSKTYGAESGLTPSERHDIEMTFATLHMHVHRGESDVLHEVLDMYNTQRIPMMCPPADLNKASIFCNAAILTAWTHCRVLPFMSPPRKFSETWVRKHNLLDQSFRLYLDSWEKPVKAAFLRLIDVSFSFQ